MGDKASRSCCGCIVQTLGESKFMRLDGFGDFVDFLPGTTFLSVDPVRDKLAAAGETFLRLSRCGPSEHLVVRLLANAELVNDGTEAEPDYTLGDHLFVELQTPVASRLVNHQLQPLWVIRVGAVVGGETQWLAQQANPTLHASGEIPGDVIALLRGQILFDWTDSRQVYANNTYTMLTLAGEMQLSTLRIAGTSNPFVNLPVAYLATRDATVIDGEASVSVARGKIFRLKRLGIDPNVVADASLLSSWEIVDRDDMPMRSLLSAYGRRGVFDVPTWNAVRIEETQDWPDHGHVGINIVADEAVTETYLNSFSRIHFQRSSEGSEFRFANQSFIQATGPPDELASQVTFTVPNMTDVIGADLLVSSDFDASAYEVAVVASQSIQTFTELQAVFDAAPADAKFQPAITRFQGNRIDISDAVAGIALALPNANAIDLLVRMVGSGTAFVSARLAIRYESPSTAIYRTFGVRPVQSLRTVNDTDTAMPSPSMRIEYSDDGAEVTRFVSVAEFPILDLENISSIRLDLTGSGTTPIPLRFAIATAEPLADMAAFDAVMDAADPVFTRPSVLGQTFHEIISPVRDLEVTGETLTKAAILFDRLNDTQGRTDLAATVRIEWTKPYMRSVTGVGIREATVPLQSYCVDPLPREWWHTMVTEADGKMKTYPAVTIVPSFDPEAISDEDLNTLSSLSDSEQFTNVWEFQRTFTNRVNFVAGGRLAYSTNHVYLLYLRNNSSGTLSPSQGGFTLQIDYRIQEVWFPGKRRQVQFFAETFGSVASSPPQFVNYETKATSLTTSQWSFSPLLSAARRTFFEGKTFTATFPDAMLD